MNLRLQRRCRAVRRDERNLVSTTRRSTEDVRAAQRRDRGRLNTRQRNEPTTALQPGSRARVRETATVRCKSAMCCSLARNRFQPQQAHPNQVSSRHRRVGARARQVSLHDHDDRAFLRMRQGRLATASKRATTSSKTFSHLNYSTVLP